MKVSISGLTGSYSDIAARAFLGPSAEVFPCNNDEAAALAVKEGRVDCALLPIENSHSGSFPATVDIASQHGLVVVGEWVQPEDHVVAALPGTGARGVTSVHSHPHVLDQCGPWLASAFPNAELVLATDTAQAAHSVRQTGKAGAAAVCSREAAKGAGLEVVGEYNSDAGISFCTRYLQLARQAAPVAFGTGVKTVLSIALKNTPSSLFKAISCFALRDLNISRLETRPSARAGMALSIRPFEYMTLIEAEGVAGDPRLDAAIANLKEFSAKVTVLGTFPKFVPPAPAVSSSLHPYGG